MSQLNLHLTPEFERTLRRLMRKRGLTNKSEAIRIAVREALERSERGARVADFRSLLGSALVAPVNRHPRFASEDDLWNG